MRPAGAFDQICKGIMVIRWAEDEMDVRWTAWRAVSGLSRQLTRSSFVFGSFVSPHDRDMATFLCHFRMTALKGPLYNSHLRTFEETPRHCSRPPAHSALVLNCKVKQEVRVNENPLWVQKSSCPYRLAVQYRCHIKLLDVFVSGMKAAAWFWFNLW